MVSVEAALDREFQLPGLRRRLAVLRIISGRARRGILDHALHRCGGIHLDIVKGRRIEATPGGCQRTSSRPGCPAIHRLCDAEVEIPLQARVRSEAGFIADRREPVTTPAASMLSAAAALALFMSPGLAPYSAHGEESRHSQKARQNPEIQSAKFQGVAPDVQPIGPALAELLNPAINRGDAGMGSGTGLQPPPDNSWDRRAGGEAAAHRAGLDASEAASEMRRHAPRGPHPPSPAAGGSDRGPGTRERHPMRSCVPSPARGRAGQRARMLRPRRSPASQLRHRGDDPDARSGTGEAARLADRRG